MEFIVAETVGMSVGRLRSEMSNHEFVTWSVYLARKAQRRQVGQ